MEFYRRNQAHQHVMYPQIPTHIATIGVPAGTHVVSKNTAAFFSPLFTANWRVQVNDIRLINYDLLCEWAREDYDSHKEGISNALSWCAAQDAAAEMAKLVEAFPDLHEYTLSDLCDTAIDYDAPIALAWLLLFGAEPSHDAIDINLAEDRPTGPVTLDKDAPPRVRPLLKAYVLKNPGSDLAKHLANQQREVPA